jgi:hypothetical protein
MDINNICQLLKNKKGGTNSIEFIIYFTIIVFIMFAGVDYYVTQVRYNIVERIKDQALDRMRIEGWLSEPVKDQIITKLQGMGYRDIQITGTVEGEVSQPVLRNVQDPGNSVIRLVISCKPRETPFLFGRLLGARDQGEFVIRVGGEVLSEKPL